MLSEEYVVVMAHYDHLGVTLDGKVYCGAFDNASGVAVALELARLLMSGSVTFSRSVIFMFTDDEEAGLLGSQAWINEPTVSGETVVAAVSVDPVGRPLLPDYWPIVVMGAERSPGLKDLWREAAQYVDEDLDVVFIHRDLIPVFASDQDSFYEAPDPVPAAWFVNPGFSFYHTTDDSPATVDYRVLLGTTRFMAQALMLMTEWEETMVYMGPPEVSALDAQEALQLFYGVAESEVLSDDEREQLDSYIGPLEEVVEADDISVLSNPDAFFFSATFFVLYTLGPAHPGPIPPPFPQ